MDATTFPDERLELVFTCCHPALATDAQVALDRALALRGRGAYVVQAASRPCMQTSPRDWPQIAALDGELARLTDSPVVELSRAVAVAEQEGPEAGLAIVDRLALEDYRYLHATRGRAAAPPRSNTRGSRRLPPCAGAGPRRRRAAPARAAAGAARHGPRPRPVNDGRMSWRRRWPSGTVELTLS